MFTPRSHDSRSIAMVRAGEKAHLYEICRDCGVVTIGWFHTPPRDMSLWGPSDLEEHFDLDYPIGMLRPHRDGTSTVWTKRAFTRDLNQIGDFLFSLNPGRRVTVASPGLEELLIGEITGPYEFRGAADRTVIKYPYFHFKPVRWLATLQRRDMSEGLVRYISNHRYQTVFWFDGLDLLYELESMV